MMRIIAPPRGKAGGGTAFRLKRAFIAAGEPCTVVRNNGQVIIDRSTDLCIGLGDPNPDALYDGRPNPSPFPLAHKAGQRRRLDEMGIKTPNSYEPNGKWVVRPLNHHGGRGFEVMEQEEKPRYQGKYSSPMFNRTHEYRVVYLRGERMFTLLKRVDEGMPQDVPWNHDGGSSFVTVNNWENNRLRHSYFFEHFEDEYTSGGYCPCCEPRPTAGDFFAHVEGDLIGVDVLYNADTRDYAVCEVNFAPGLTIEANLNAIVTKELQHEC